METAFRVGRAALVEGETGTEACSYAKAQASVAGTTRLTSLSKLSQRFPGLRWGNSESVVCLIQLLFCSSGGLHSCFPLHTDWQQKEACPSSGDDRRHSTASAWSPPRLGDPAGTIYNLYINFVSPTFFVPLTFFLLAVFFGDAFLVAIGTPSSTGGTQFCGN